jgi:hypothetical protein
MPKKKGVVLMKRPAAKDAKETTKPAKAETTPTHSPASMHGRKMAMVVAADKADRRDTPTKAARAIDAHVSAQDQVLASTKVDGQGRSLHTRVVADIRSYRAQHVSKGNTAEVRLTTAYWCHIFAEYGLGSAMKVTLEDPGEPSDGDQDPELGEALYMLTHPNPASRTGGALESWLELAGELSKVQMFAILTQIQESPQVPRQVSDCLHIALFEHESRTTDFPLR